MSRTFKSPCFSPRPWLKSGLWLGFLLLVSHWSLPNLQGQTPDPIDTISIDSDLVNLNLSVVNRMPASQSTQLDQKYFAVFEDGVPQEVSFFASQDTPFDLVLLLDLSGSTSDRIDLIRKSAKRFVDAARPVDRIAVFTFTSEISAVSSFTSDHEALKKSIGDIKKPSGGTSFWDALRFVLDHVVGQSRVENRRSAAVVMTDGVDNALPDVDGEGSRTSFEDLLKIVQHSDTTVLPIYLDTEKELEKRGRWKDAYALARQQLALIAAESGNEVYQARKLKDLEGVYQQVIRDLSTVYSIGYRPSNLVRDGSWRAVSVQLIGHKGLAVHTRRGYYRK